MREFRRLHDIEVTPFRERSLLDQLMFSPRRRRFYWELSRNYGAFVGVGLRLGKNPKFHHDFLGIFIADRALIGDNVFIYHQVTIGRKGDDAPVIGDDVFIGAGAIILGRCRIGNGARIGAGVTLVDVDIPAGSVIINKSAFNYTTGEPVYPQEASVQSRGPDRIAAPN